MIEYKVIRVIDGGRGKVVIRGNEGRVIRKEIVC